MYLNKNYPTRKQSEFFLDLIKSHIFTNKKCEFNAEISRVRHGGFAQIKYCPPQITGFLLHIFLCLHLFLSIRVILQIMDTGRGSQDTDAGVRAPEQAAHLHPQHVQRHRGEVDDVITVS